MENKRINTKLFQRYLSNDVSEDELKILMRFFGNPSNQDELRQLINREIDRAEDFEHDHAVTQLIQGLDQKVFERTRPTDTSNDPYKRVKNIMLRKYRNWLGIAASLTLFFVLGLKGYHWYSERQDDQQIRMGLNAVKPGGNRAILAFEGGRFIELDSTQSGVSMQDNDIRYDNGELVGRPDRVDGSEATQGTEVFAILVTPAGGQYQLILSDGSKVWLNASSSLKYPVHFGDSTRVVELEGEGYFEIAKDSHRPFLVKSKDQLIEVLGTKFNVNSYANEGKIVTTLVEGSVAISNPLSADPHQLKPGHQAVLREGQFGIEKVSVEEYIGWKEGKFIFNRVTLPVVLRQIERWYDVSFHHEGEVPELPLWGTLSRDVYLSELLQALEINTGFNFKLEGRRIIMSK